MFARIGKLIKKLASRAKTWLGQFKWYHWLVGGGIGLGVCLIEPLAIGFAAIHGPMIEGKSWSPQANICLGILYFTIAIFLWFFCREIVLVLAIIKAMELAKGLCDHIGRRWKEVEPSPQSCPSC